jgi:hypothetical protein
MNTLLCMSPFDVSPPGLENDPLAILAVAAFGFAVVMWVWVRRRSGRGDDRS